MIAKRLNKILEVAASRWKQPVDKTKNLPKEFVSKIKSDIIFDLLLKVRYEFASTVDNNSFVFVNGEQSLAIQRIPGLNIIEVIFDNGVKKSNFELECGSGEWFFINPELLSDVRWSYEDVVKFIMRN